MSEHFVELMFKKFRQQLGQNLFDRMFDEKTAGDALNYVKKNLILRDGEWKYFCITASVFSAYMKHKYFIKIDPALSSGILNIGFPENFPTEHFFLPRPSVILDSRFGGAIACTYMCDGKGIKVINFAMPRIALEIERTPDYSQPFFQDLGSIDLTKPTLGEAAASMLKTMPDMTRYLLNVLLYILGDNDVVADVHPGSPPAKANPRRVKDKIAKRTTTVEIGSGYARLVERYAEQEAKQKSQGEATGRTKRPHMRSAHAHRFWTGKRDGERKPIVKFLPPTYVGGKFLDVETDNLTRVNLK